MKATCNNCLETFDIEKDGILYGVFDGLDIQYFRCPSCGYPFVILAEDKEMKQLIAERSEVQKKIRMARAGKFREQTLRKLILRQEEISMKQKKLMADLKPRAERLLVEGADHGKV